MVWYHGCEWVRVHLYCVYACREALLQRADSLQLPPFDLVRIVHVRAGGMQYPRQLNDTYFFWQALAPASPRKQQLLAFARGSVLSERMSVHVAADLRRLVGSGNGFEDIDLFALASQVSGVSLKATLTQLCQVYHLPTFVPLHLPIVAPGFPGNN